MYFYEIGAATENDCELFLHTSDEILTFSISRFQKYQNIKRISMILDVSLGVTEQNVHKTSGISMILYVSLGVMEQHVNKIKGISIILNNSIHVTKQNVNKT